MEHHVLTVSAAERSDVIADLAAAPGRTILSTRTKHGAKKLAKQLNGRGIPAVDLHGTSPRTPACGTWRPATPAAFSASAGRSVRRRAR